MEKIVLLVLSLPSDPFANAPLLNSSGVVVVVPGNACNLEAWGIYSYIQARTTELELDFVHTTPSAASAPLK